MVGEQAHAVWVQVVEDIVDFGNTPIDVGQEQGREVAEAVRSSLFDLGGLAAAVTCQLPAHFVVIGQMCAGRRDAQNGLRGVGFIHHLDVRFFIPCLDDGAVNKPVDHLADTVGGTY